MSLKILLSNDDGFSAPGINILFKELKKIAQVTMVAPLEERSTTGHTLTLNSPIRVSKISDDVFGCSGFPADCVYWGLSKIYNDQKPDLVVSGINRGANLGQDIYYSGTAAAAREGAIHGIKSISVSTVLDNDMTVNDVNYEAAAITTRLMIEKGITEHIEDFSFLNINAPDTTFENCQKIALCQLGYRQYSEKLEERIDARGRKYYWIAGLYEGHKDMDGLTDCEMAAKGHVTATHLSLFGPVNQNKEKLAQALDEINFLK